MGPLKRAPLLPSSSSLPHAMYSSLVLGKLRVLPVTWVQFVVKQVPHQPSSIINKKVNIIMVAPSLFAPHLEHCLVTTDDVVNKPILASLNG